MIHYPYLQEQPSSRRTVDVFRGLNRNERIGEGEFCDMQNLTSDYYPVLSPSGKRGLVTFLHETVYITGGYYVPDNGVYFSCNEQADQGEADRGSLYFLDRGGSIHRLSSDLSIGEKSFALMGRRLVVAPDMIAVDVDRRTGVEYLNDIRTAESGTVNAYLCNRDGTPYQNVTVAADAPTNVGNMALWLDTSKYPRTLMQYTALTAEWTAIPTVYVKLNIPMNHQFNMGDGIKIEGLVDEATSLNGSHIVQNCTDGGIVIIGTLDEKFNQDCTTNPVTISRTVPKMEYIVEAGNRLWGCNSEYNEIYGSKLGDYKNWNVFAGISTDSWVASVGTPGNFTGAINHGGYPVFYKQDSKHKIWPSSNGAHQLSSTPCNGVMSGCAHSLAVYGNNVLYLSVNGVCLDDGSGPVVISQKLEPGHYQNGRGTVHRDKYYLCINSDSSLFVYDLRKQLWHREESASSGFIISDGSSLFAAEGDVIWDMTGSRGTLEGKVRWSATTGDLMLSAPDHQYISRLTLRLSLEPESRLDIYARYDHEDRWVKLGTAYGRKPGSFTLPVRPRRCDHLQLKLEGQGMGKIYSITQTLEKGSELS